MNFRHRLSILYFTLAGLCLAIACFTNPPLQHILLILGITLIAAFAPFIMLIDFLRGLRGLR